MFDVPSLLMDFVDVSLCVGGRSFRKLDDVDGLDGERL